MIPGNKLSNPSPIYSIYMPPDGDPGITALIDYELGGIDLYDGSQGLQVQVWTLTLKVIGTNTDYYISSPNTASTYLFSRSYGTWGRLAFDQNMFPIISYVDINGAGYYWYDPIAHAYAFVTMDSTVSFPCVTMDDKRYASTRLGTNDVILAYMNNNNLCYRQQRDRYGTEYVLLSNVGTIIPNPSVWKVGMNDGYRLQFQITGNAWQ